MQKIILALALATAPVRHPRDKKFNLTGVSTMVWRPRLAVDATPSRGNSCAQVVDSMGYAGCTLACELDAIDPAHQEFSGTVCVQDNGDGIIFSGELQGLLPSTSGGFHIHAGTSCLNTETQGGHYWSGKSACPVAPDPWTGDYDAVWNSDEFGNASPYNVNPGSKQGPPPITGGPFTIGTDDSTCGVTGHTVIVHKGCPAENPECGNGGDRIGCCVLA